MRQSDRHALASHPRRPPVRGSSPRELSARHLLLRPGRQPDPQGYVFLPSREARRLDTETKTYYSGEQAYPHGTHGLGWRAVGSLIGSDRLPVGQYLVQLQTTYTFMLGDIVIEGANASPKYKVEITAGESKAARPSGLNAYYRVRSDRRAETPCCSILAKKSFGQ
ncbi:MAG: hypothetical protein GY854_13445 [Deltaproteobacteria bacterium]|nr:hypothetical protein [Deltaproteobacteria bacterium]